MQSVASARARARQRVMASTDDAPLDVAEYASSLAASCDASPAAAAHVASLLADACRAAFQLRCSRAALEAFVGALAASVRDDLAEWPRGAAASFAAFRERVLALAVERPPASRGVLNPLQASGAVDFALRAYYAHFALFKAVCARSPVLDLAQRSAGDVDAPPAPPPLAAAVLLA